MDQGVFASPGYPDDTKYPYKTPVVCDIIIEVSEGRAVQLEFKDLDIGSWRSGDYVQVRKLVVAFVIADTSVARDHNSCFLLFLSLMS